MPGAGNRDCFVGCARGFARSGPRVAGPRSRRCSAPPRNNEVRSGIGWPAPGFVSLALQDQSAYLKRPYSRNPPQSDFPRRHRRDVNQSLIREFGAFGGSPGIALPGSRRFELDMRVPMASAHRATRASCTRVPSPRYLPGRRGAQRGTRPARKMPIPPLSNHRRGACVQSPRHPRTCGCRRQGCESRTARHRTTAPPPTSRHCLLRWPDCCVLRPGRSRRL